jgi:phospholipid transport system transporter-binding protein
MYAVPAAVTMGNASKSLADLRRAIDGGETEVGLQALAHSDSSALAVILAGVRHAQTTGRVLRVSGMPASLQSLARLYGVEGLLQPA